MTISAPTENGKKVLTMDEYIGREEAKQFFNLNFGGVSHAIIAARLLDEIPAADVATVRHGRWIKESDGGTRCSVCNKRVRDVTGGGDEPVDLSDMPYCPKCGAKMYGGADNG